MKTRIVTIVLLCSFVIVGFFQIVHAQEIRTDKKSVTKDKVAIMDDRRDLDRLSDLIIKWDRLRKTNNLAALDQIEAQIAIELRKDLKETQLETALAKKEVKQSTNEVKRSKTEARRERRDRDLDKKALKDDVHDRRDDKRDLKDDVRDAQKTEQLLEQKRTVARDLIALQKQIDMPGKKGDKVLQSKQRALLEEYLKLSQQEIQMGIRELNEDQQELREDRRERREDQK